MRFILYARASTKDKQHPEHQIAELRAWAAGRGHEVVAAEIERESGRKDDRPVFGALLSRVLRREADGFACTELSRFGRSVPHLLEVSTALERAGAELVCTRQPVDTTTPAGRLLFTILAAVGAFEADLTRERVRAGVAFAIKQRGGAWGRPRAVLSAQTLSYAAKIRAEGHSWRAVAQVLHGAGLSQPELYRAGVCVRPARAWPVGTLRDALARVELPPSKPGT
jgi:DNA invertase Pin-like site-specific DNA recombinase